MAIASRASASGNTLWTRGVIAPCLREHHAALHLVPVVDEGADDLLLAAEEGDDVEGHDLSRVTAADHKASVLAQRVERLLEQVAADVLVCEVRALPVRQPHDLADDVLRACG